MKPGQGKQVSSYLKSPLRRYRSPLRLRRSKINKSMIKKRSTCGKSNITTIVYEKLKKLKLKYIERYKIMACNQVPPRFELGLLDSESRVLNVTQFAQFM